MPAARTHLIAKRRGTIGAYKRLHVPDSDPRMIAARARLQAAMELADHSAVVRDLIAAWPELDDTQRRQVAQLVDGPLK